MHIPSFETIARRPIFAKTPFYVALCKKRDDLNDKWADATAWAAGADMVAKRMWSRMRLAEEHERANRECMQMALEERRAALIDRKIALNIRDHAVEAQLLAERTCEVALRSSSGPS